MQAPMPSHDSNANLIWLNNWCALIVISTGKAAAKRPKVYPTKGTTGKLVGNIISCCWAERNGPLLWKSGLIFVWHAIPELWLFSDWSSHAEVIDTCSRPCKKKYGQVGALWSIFPTVACCTCRYSTSEGENLQSPSTGICIQTCSRGALAESLIFISSALSNIKESLITAYLLFSVLISDWSRNRII